MNLSRLVSIAGFKKKSKQEDFKEGNQQSSKVADSMWSDCLVSSAPTTANFKKEQETHPLEKACTEAEYLESLVKTIEGKILPHIIERHLESSIPEDLLAKAIIDETRISELTQLVLQEDARTSVTYVKTIHTSGTSLEDIYLLLLTPVARKLGQMWEEDESSFTEVTIALWRIKQLMYDLSPVFQQYAEQNKTGSSIMLVPLPGSQHNLGLFMVSEFFARAGWRIWGELAATEEEIIAMSANEWFDVVGLSASVREQFPQLKELIKSIKAKSKNPHVGVIIGSPVFNQFPELVDTLGADMVGIDAADALEKATFYVERLRKI
ncbi:cobalamin B12-binding domain-containing protein [Polynucleobacter sp. 15G-AUS-farblos]|uniref:cobalamin B12-binding domain-containing protein n=1 Tax=Polynucleobacter sp. 15G-AUS-farblos TaxID=2689094 RepID=UPI001C0E5F8D|nr:cobalamin B12-binding domain-containing protein [Polynucleobacter sp. 15G-AUS-farblos]MBU3582947.1 cobalamin B12-binding domain-containing protein [Polynucleobacter sp. 15G-AUS-farblos]